jgi:choline dehydrogenase
VRVSRILFTGHGATGVAFIVNGTEIRVEASREIILCAGAINSPQILKLSGIGPADELKGRGIAVKADLPGVGENLQDHLDFLVQYRCLKPVSFYPATTPLGRLKVGLQWLLFKQGIGATNIWETGSFFRSRPGVAYLNLQHHFAPVAISYDGNEKIDGHGFQVHLSQMRPRSRGWVRLRSADPFAPPRVLFNHLMDAEDRQEVRDGLRITRDLVAQKAFDPYRGEEIAPGAKVQSDAELDAFARAKAETSHHPSCTCCMGLDEMAVVDGDGKVHGVEGLRVIDASIMPDVVTANLNATVLLMAEKLADRIAGKAPLPPQQTDHYR